MFFVSIACAAAIVVEVAAVTGFFGLANHDAAGSSGPKGPNLNPYNERILAIEGAIDYTGSAKGYFIGLDQNLCALTCPELPTEFLNWTPPQIGVIFYYNVTNSAAVSENISLPEVTTSGPDGTLWQVGVFCCYGAISLPYNEWIMGTTAIGPSATLGYKAYAWTVEAIPEYGSGGFTLDSNFTSW